MRIFNKKAIGILLISLTFSSAYSQRIDYDVTSESTIYLKAVYNDDGKNHDYWQEGLDDNRRGC